MPIQDRAARERRHDQVTSVVLAIGVFALIGGVPHPENVIHRLAAAGLYFIFARIILEIRRAWLELDLLLLEEQ